MGGAARSHGGTRGHGYIPLQGERPNFNFHTLSDNTLSKIVKSNKVKTVANPSGTKVVCVNKLQTVNSAKCVYEKVQNNEKELDEEKKVYSSKIQQSMKTLEKVVKQGKGKLVDKKQVKFRKTHQCTGAKMSQNVDDKKQGLDHKAMNQVDDVNSMDRMTKNQAVAKEMESRTKQRMSLQEKAENEIIDFVEIKQHMDKSTMQKNVDHDVLQMRDVGKATEDEQELEDSPKTKGKQDVNSVQHYGNSRNKAEDAKFQNEKAKIQMLDEGERNQMMDEKARHQAMGVMIDQNGIEQISGEKVRGKMLDEKISKQMLGEKANEKMIDEKNRDQMTEVKEQVMEGKPIEILVEDRSFDQTKRVDNNQVCQHQTQRNYRTNDKEPKVAMPHNASQMTPQQKQSLSGGHFALLPVVQQCAMVRGTSFQHQMIRVPPMMHFYLKTNWFILPCLNSKNISSQHHQSPGNWRMSSHTVD